MVNYGATEPIVILGFGEMGQVSCMVFFLLHCEYRLHIIILIQVLAKFLSAPLSFGLDREAEGWPYVTFDLNPAVVKVRNNEAFWYNSCLLMLRTNFPLVLLDNLKQQLLSMGLQYLFF